MACSDNERLERHYRRLQKAEYRQHAQRASHYAQALVQSHQRGNDGRAGTQEAPAPHNESSPMGHKPTRTLASTRDGSNVPVQLSKDDDLDRSRAVIAGEPALCVIPSADGPKVHYAIEGGIESPADDGNVVPPRAPRIARLKTPDIPSWDGLQWCQHSDDKSGSADEHSLPRLVKQDKMDQQCECQ